MYYDLCLPHDEADAVVHRLRLGTLLKLGYGACAACQSVTGQVSLSDRYHIHMYDYWVGAFMNHDCLHVWLMQLLPRAHQ